MSSLEPLKCSVCQQECNGVHFGVVACKPCAAFFRRCVSGKRTYKCLRGKNNCNIQLDGNRKGCKACRMRICLHVGMSPKAVNRDLQHGNNNFPGHSASLLSTMTEAYRSLLDGQQKITQQMNGAVPWVEEQQRMKAVFFNLFNNFIVPFHQMDHQRKINLMDKMFYRLYFLHYCRPTMEQFANNRILGGIEQMAIFGKLIDAIPAPIHPHDRCALMAICLWNGATKQPINNVAEWDNFKETILREWHNQIIITRSLTQSDSALLMCRLLCLLIELESLISSANEQIPLNSFDLKRKKQRQSVSMATRDISKEAKELQYLVRLVNAHNRIWGAFNDLPDHYTAKYGGFADLIGTSENVLGKFELFTENPEQLSDQEKAKFLQEIEQLGASQRHPRIQKAILVYQLISVGLAKAMPVFRLIGLEDQVILARSLEPPIKFFVNGFYAAQLGCHTWKGKDGITSTDIYRATPRFRNDPRIFSLIEKSLSRSVKLFLMYPMPQIDEFALLLGILCAYAAIPELSSNAKELLYAEQKRYSAQLLHLLQARYGAAPGAARYANHVLLIESAFYSSHNYQLLITYQETVHLREDYRNLLPEQIKKIII